VPARKVFCCGKKLSDLNFSSPLFGPLLFLMLRIKNEVILVVGFKEMKKWRDMISCRRIISAVKSNS
jgi:hypothetical protein